MDSMLKPKLSDDPHDILVVAPDAIRVAPDPVRVAPAVEEPSDPIRDLMRGGSSEPQIHAGSDFSAGATVPPVDTTFRPTAVNDVLAPRRGSIGRRALRAVTALLLTACIGGAAVAWNAHGDAALQLIAEWAPLFAHSALVAVGENGLSAQPTLAAAQVDAAQCFGAATGTSGPGPRRQAVRQPPPRGIARPDAVDRDDGARSGQCRAGDRSAQGQHRAAQGEPAATGGDGVREGFRAGGAAQKTRNRATGAAAATGRSTRAGAQAGAAAFTAVPPRQAISAPPLPTAPAPYVPRQIEPLPPTTAETLADPELPSVPRPPMPLR